MHSRDEPMSKKSAKSACLFCQRLNLPAERQAPLIYEDSLVHVTHELDGEGCTYLGTVLIQTKRHTEAGLSSLTDEEGERIGELVAQISRALRELVGASWCYTYCFTEVYRHVHQFVVARYPQMPQEHVRLGATEWPEAPRGSSRDVRQLARALRDRVGPKSAARNRTVSYSKPVRKDSIRDP
jgi:diadenosine tetraphosphate (Ap4A) HIT family hydrolase